MAIMDRSTLFSEFFKTRGLYEITLWDKFKEDLFYDKGQLWAYRLMETMGLLNIEKLKELMQADKKRLEMFPSRLGGTYSENVQTKQDIKQI